MSDNQLPLISLLFPLYQSKRYLDIIIQNIRAVRYTNVEFIFSDRHCLDDSIDQLESIFQDKNRYRFFRSNDRQGWLYNMNFLFSQAKGKYIRYMPHDDNFPTCGLNEMVDEIQNHPGTILVFGPVFRNNTGGQYKGLEPLDQSLEGFNDNLWNDEWIVRFNHPMKAIGSMRGLIDLDRIKAADLNILHAEMMADRFFLFGLAILGNFRYIESGISIKNMKNDGASSSWIRDYKRKPRKYWSNYLLTQWRYVNHLIKNDRRKLKFKVSLVQHAVPKLIFTNRKLVK